MSSASAPAHVAAPRLGPLTVEDGAVVVRGGSAAVRFAAEGVEFRQARALAPWSNVAALTVAIPTRTAWGRGFAAVLNSVGAHLVAPSSAEVVVSWDDPTAHRTDLRLGRPAEGRWPWRDAYALSQLTWVLGHARSLPALADPGFVSAVVERIRRVDERSEPSVRALVRDIVTDELHARPPATMSAAYLTTPLDAALEPRFRPISG